MLPKGLRKLLVLRPCLVEKARRWGVKVGVDRIMLPGLALGLVCRTWDTLSLRQGHSRKGGGYRLWW